MKYFWNEDCENDEENNEDIKDMRNRELGNRRTKMSDQFTKNYDCQGTFVILLKLLLQSS